MKAPEMEYVNSLINIFFILFCYSSHTTQHFMWSGNYLVPSLINLMRNCGYRKTMARILSLMQLIVVKLVGHTPVYTSRSPLIITGGSAADEGKQKEKLVEFLTGLYSFRAAVEAIMSNDEGKLAYSKYR